MVFEGVLEIHQGLHSVCDLWGCGQKGGCGHFMGLNGNPHFTSEFCRAQSAERQLNSLIPIPNHVRFNLLHEILQCDTLPRTTIVFVTDFVSS